MLDRIARFFTSLKLAVVCLGFAVVLVFIGTLAQVDEGLYAVQARYFQSFVIWWSPKGADWKIPVFPGGYLIGGLLLINLIASFVERLRLVRGRIGLMMAHAGLILLLVGQFATDQLAVESHMRLTQGEPSNYSEASRDTELAVVETTDKEADQVFPIPEHLLARQSEIKLPELPFVIRVRQYQRNARLFQRAGEGTNHPPASIQGVGRDVVLQAAPAVTKMDERNVPAAVIELATPKGSLGTWLVGLALDQPQPLSVEGRSFTLQLRPTRYYKPFSLTLLKFTHDKYPGTDIPKNFSSRVRVERPDTGENREALIYMNNPLRYAGETYYQSSYDERDPRVSILQVVRNPTALSPYHACRLVGIGLLIHFLSHILDFLGIGAACELNRSKALGVGLPPRQTSSLAMIRGWLLLPAIGLVGSLIIPPLALVGELARPGEWIQDGATASAVAFFLLWGGYWFYSGCVTYWFFRRRANVPDQIGVWVLVGMIVGMCHDMIAGGHFGAAAGAFPEMFRSYFVLLWAFGIFSPVLWILYFTRSKRVAATFVH